MDIKKELTTLHSRHLTLKIQSWVGNDENRFKELMLLMLSDDKILSQRSSWAVSYCIEAHPSLAEKWLPQLLKRLQQPAHDAVIRNILRSLRIVRLPEALHSEIVERCFQFIQQKQQPPAIKAFAMHLLGSMCEIYPELRTELKAIIETGMEVESPAFRSVANQLLKQWRKKQSIRRIESVID